MRRAPDSITVTGRRPRRVTEPAVLADVDEEGDLAGGGYLVCDEETLIGRGASCEVRLDDSNISREHARIVGRGGVHVLTDLKSKNGTEVNGRAIIEHVLRHGDLVKFGRILFRYVEDDGRWVSAGSNCSAEVLREGMASAERTEGCRVARARRAPRKAPLRGGE